MCSEFDALAPNTVVLFPYCFMCRFTFPNIILLYVTASRVMLSVFHLVGYFDEKELYCTSRDRVTSFEEGSAYCNISGILVQQ